MVIKLCTSFDQSSYMNQVSEKYLERFQSYEQTRFTYKNLRRGIILYKSLVKIQLLYSAYCLIMFCICTFRTKFHKNIICGFEVSRDTVSMLNI